MSSALGIGPSTKVRNLSGGPAPELPIHNFFPEFMGRGKKQAEGRQKNPKRIIFCSVGDQSQGLVHTKYMLYRGAASPWDVFLNSCSKLNGWLSQSSEKSASFISAGNSIWHIIATQQTFVERIHESPGVITVENSKMYVEGIQNV